MWNGRKIGLLNGLKSLVQRERLLNRRDRRKSRRNSTAALFPSAAEVLELRRMLTPNVTAAVSGTALTLTSDNTGDPRYQGDS